MRIDRERANSYEIQDFTKVFRRYILGSELEVFRKDMLLTPKDQNGFQSVGSKQVTLKASCACEVGLTLVGSQEKLAFRRSYHTELRRFVLMFPAAYI